jgi:DNA N-6-adenine-methyltransferase Dam
MALHEQCVGATDEWYTPPYVFDAMGCSFDLDVAHPGAPFASWIPAPRYIVDDSLCEPWQGFIWMNPPFGRRNGIVPWLDRFVRHGNGVALVPDRTSAPWWQKYAARMDRILFVSPKIKFVGRDGSLGRSPAQGTCLMSLGALGGEALARAEGNGLGLMMAPCHG